MSYWHSKGKHKSFKKHMYYEWTVPETTILQLEDSKYMSNSPPTNMKHSFPVNTSSNDANQWERRFQRDLRLLKDY